VPPPVGEASIGGGEVEDEVVREHVTTPARDDHHVVTVIFASGGGTHRAPCWDQEAEGYLILNTGRMWRWVTERWWIWRWQELDRW
jgi:hypothetical protein